MSARIFDKTVLDQEADFTFKVTIPEGSYNVKNPDGTEPVVSLKVTGPSIQYVLSLLSVMNENESMLDIIATQLLGEDFPELVESNPDLLVSKLTEVHPEFLEFAFNATDEGTQREASFTLTAPTGLIGYQAFQSVTSKERLNAFIANLMPLADDEEDWDLDY